MSRHYRMTHTCKCAPHGKALQNDTHVSMCTACTGTTEWYTHVRTLKNIHTWHCALHIKTLHNDTHMSLRTASQDTPHTHQETTEWYTRVTVHRMSRHYRMIHTCQCAPLCTACQGTTERYTHFRTLQNDTTQVNVHRVLDYRMMHTFQDTTEWYIRFTVHRRSRH